MYENICFLISISIEDCIYKVSKSLNIYYYMRNKKVFAIINHFIKYNTIEIYYIIYLILYTFLLDL